MNEWKVNNCPRCGGPLKSMSEDIKFCPYCGVELEKVIPEGKFTLNINKHIKEEITNKNVIRDETVISNNRTVLLLLILSAIIGFGGLFVIISL